MQQNCSFLAFLLVLGLTSANPILHPNPNFPSQPQQPSVGLDPVPETVIPGQPGSPPIIDTTAPAAREGLPTVHDASDRCKMQGQEVYCCGQDPYAVHSGVKMTCNVILSHKPEGKFLITRILERVWREMGTRGAEKVNVEQFLPC